MSGWLLIGIFISQAIINIFLVRYEITPCNATYSLAIKTLLVIRLILGAMVIVKQEATLDWAWSTTFWPYWCSITIQSVLLIATAVMFINTIGNFFKGQAKLHEVIGSLWSVLITAGFIISSLQAVLLILKIYDVASNMPPKFFDELYTDKDRLEIELHWLNDSERYAYEMLTKRAHEIPFLVVKYPMIYFCSSFLLSLIFRNLIVRWFEQILYHDED